MCIGRSVAIVSLLALGTGAQPVRAQWLPNGVPINPSGLDQDLGRIRSDGRGGAYVAWREPRIDRIETGHDLYLQHLSSLGVIDPTWPVGGFPVCLAPTTQGTPNIEVGTDGSIYVTWSDTRSGTSVDLYASRVLPNSTLASGWELNGTPICVSPGQQAGQFHCLDGAGGMFILWEDWRNGFDQRGIFWTYLDSAGGLMPGWPANGRPFLDSTERPQLLNAVPAGDGGLWVVWSDDRNSTPWGSRLYLTRTAPDGSLVPGWPADGALLKTTGSAHGGYSAIVSDGAGGAFVAWNDGRSIPSPGMIPEAPDLYAQHVLVDGVIDPRWPADGLAITRAPNSQISFDMESDGSGGVFLVWTGGGDDNTGIYGQRILENGLVAPGWSAHGRPLTTTLSLKDYAQAVADGGGGFYATWEQGEPTTGRGEIYAQHVRADGSLAPGWFSTGLPVAAEPTVSYRAAHSVQPDGAGGVILAFRAGSATGARIHAHRIGNDGPVATRVALLDAVVRDGEVVVRWQSSDAANLRASVERRTESEDWILAGTAHLEGTDRLVHRESGLTPGRHAFRLRYVEDGVEQVSEPTWVEVEAVAAFRLEGFRPNPARAGVAVAFALPDAGPATLLVHDARGRIVHRRDVGDRGAGSHVVRVDEGASLPAGIYWVRLVRSGATFQAKGVVIR